VDTRKRAACDLVKVLFKYFEVKVTEILGPYTQVDYNERNVVIEQFTL